MHPLVRSAIKEYRSKMTDGQRKASIASVFRQKYPNKAEKAVDTYVANLYSKAVGPIIKYLKNNIPEYEKNRGVTRIDTESQEIINTLDLISLGAEVTIEQVPDKDYEELLALILLLAVNEWERFIIKYAGTTVPLSFDFDSFKPALISELRQYIQTNMSGIINDIKLILLDDLNKKAVYQKTYNKIFEKYKTLLITRSKYIARNFVARANSTALQFIFTTAGFPLYVWNVHMDEVLRGNPAGKYANKIPSHFAMSSIICQWVNDSVYSTDGINWIPRTEMMEFKRPGMAVNCRCTGQIFITNDLRKIDNER